ncbi:MAG TPA: glycerophosphodiester phosphodiesterase family protein [Thermodesulfobacteriota bacterium]
MTRPLVIAHRGASGYAPENTLAAFRAAIALGADMIELDVHPTADGRLAVIHDESIDRTCDGRGFVREMTLAEIKSFDAGAWWGPGFAGERVPALEEVLALTRGRVQVNVEIKAPRDGTGPGRIEASVVAPLLAALDATGTRREVLVSSFDPAVLRTLRAAAPDLPLGLLTEARIEGPTGFRVDRLAPLLDVAAAVGAYSLHPYWRFCGERAVHAAREAGLRVFPWTVNREADLRRVVGHGADGVITNHPDRLARVVKGYRRP